MGLWDKIKSVKNMVTGGAADVTLSVEGESIEGFVVHSRAFIKDADLKVDKVYLKVRSVEHVVAPDVDLAQDQNGNVVRVREDVRHSETTYQQEFVVSGGETLKGDTEYTWTTEVSLGEDVWPTYKGRNATHVWEVFVGLDAFGNDPDSGWIQVDLY